MYDLSCIIPVTRMANQLERLGKWLVESTDFNREVIIIHDIQDSRTGPQLREMCDKLKDRKIRIIESALGSPGKARNKGLEISQGKWIVFWDSDDLPNMREVFCAIDENKDADVIVGRFSTFNLINGLETVSSQSSLNLHGVGINPGLWRMILRRGVVNGKKFESFRMAEDQVFLSDIFLDPMSLRFSNRIVYQYFIGQPGQLSNSTINVRDLIDSFERILINSKNCYEVNRSLHILMSTRILLTIIKKFKFSGFILFLAQIKRNGNKISVAEVCSISLNISRIFIGKIKK